MGKEKEMKLGQIDVGRVSKKPHIQGRARETVKRTASGRKENLLFCGKSTDSFKK